MRLDKLPQSDRIEDRRGGRSGGFPGARSGGIGIGTVVVLGLVGWALGIDPRVLIQGADMLSKTGQSQSRVDDQTRHSVRCYGSVRLRDSW
jgi:uncharacterized protein